MTIDLRTHSVEVIRAGQSPSGAYIASPNFPTYHYSWFRDGAFIANAMDRMGQHESALSFHRWVHQTLQAHAHKVARLEEKADRGEAITAADWLHCRYTLDGQEGDAEWTNHQLDGYGTWLWALVEHARMTRSDAVFTQFASSIDLTVRYLTRFWNQPTYDSWEEHGEHLHPSTLACLYGGLRAIAEVRGGDAALESTCAAIKRYVLDHFVHEGRLTKFADGRSIDANLLWVALPFRMLEPEDPIMVATVAELERRCYTGGVHRYPEDTYYGGGEWLLLTAWLGWYHAETGNLGRARELLAWVEAQADEQGDMVEQVSVRVNDPTMVQPWVDRWGPVAKPLLWSHAMYLVLWLKITGQKGGAVDVA